jgi:hypothetical protein
MGVGGVCTGGDEAAAGVLIQAVDDARALLAADAREGGAMGKQGVDQGVARVARGGMDYEAGRLVDDQEVGVLEEDVERDILGLEERRLRGRFGNGDRISGADFVARFGGLSAEGDMALPDESLQPRARQVRDILRQETVQAVPRGACIDSEHAEG